MKKEFNPEDISGRHIVALILLAFAVILTIICIISYLFSAPPTKGFWKLVIFILTITDAIAISSYIIIQQLQSIETSFKDIADNTGKLVSKLSLILEKLDQLNENMLISDSAKAVAYRKKELKALQNAIEEEISGKDWESAEYLIEQLESKFGQRSQANEYREKLLSEKSKDLEEILGKIKSQFEEAISIRDWQRARAKIEEIKNRFEEGEKIASEWQQRLEKAYIEHKKQLLKAWDEAVKNNEIDRGIEILKELDKYLTPNEVAALEESARGMFRAKLHDLGMQFSLFVTEKMWDKAYEVGLQIIDEFPNSRMAEEIKERLAVLKANAEAIKAQEKKETE